MNCCLSFNEFISDGAVTQLKAKFNNQIEDFICSICSDVLEAANELSCCCALVCLKCFDTKAILCACEQKELPYLTVSNRVQMKMNKVRYFCPNAVSGCEMKSATLTEMKTHLDWQNLGSACSVLLKTCNHCAKLVPTQHFEEHLTTQCLSIVHACPYKKWSGCNFQATIQLMQLHKAQFEEHHLIACDFVANLKEQINLSSERSQKGLENLNERNRILLQENNELRGKIAEFKSQHQEIVNNLKKQKTNPTFSFKDIFGEPPAK